MHENMMKNIDKSNMMFAIDFAITLWYSKNIKCKRIHYLNSALAKKEPKGGWIKHNNEKITQKM